MSNAKQIYEKILETNVTKMTTEEQMKITKFILSAFIVDRCTVNKGGAKFFDWLESERYYDCPAAKSHHGNFQGGLFVHSFEVTRQLILLTELHQLNWQDEGSPIIIGMLHDVCKLKDYNYDFSREVKCMNGVGPIDYKSTFESGHGSKSILLLSSKILLTEEEALCIRYHMGAYTDSSEWKYLDEAIRKYPNVFWTHTADMIASKLENK